MFIVIFDIMKNKNCTLCKRDLNEYELDNCYIIDNVTMSRVSLCKECFIKIIEDTLKMFDTDIRQL